MNARIIAVDADRTVAVSPSAPHGAAALVADGPGVHETDRKLGILPVVGARLGRRIDAAMLQLVFLLGFAGVFLANAVVAVVEPAGFKELVAGSPIGGLVGDGAWIAPVIAVNDFLIGAAVIAAHRIEGLRSPVLAWAGVWLMIVTLMKLTTIG